ncbi:MAG: GNAT family N-acetyltransferase [Bdellovibrionales bacterium]|nr:GNAT family N-acetyltransferase [Bdellovibrionales bacterium]
MFHQFLPCLSTSGLPSAARMDDPGAVLPSAELAARILPSLETRFALPSDAEQVLQIFHEGLGKGRIRAFLDLAVNDIRKSISNGQCLVAVADEEILGYLAFSLVQNDAAIFRAVCDGRMMAYSSVARDQLAGHLKALAAQHSLPGEVSIDFLVDIDEAKARSFPSAGSVYVSFLEVRADQQNMGIGSRLLVELVHSRFRNAAEIYVHSSEEESAVQFYKKHGFDPLIRFGPVDERGKRGVFMARQAQVSEGASASHRGCFSS